MNRWLKRLGRAVAVPFFALVALIAIPSDPQDTPPPIDTGYAAPCDAKDRACETWRTFRRAHPFPYQAVAVGEPRDGQLTLVLSEPPPSLDRGALDDLLRETFGASVGIQRMRWMIGVDGWLEDVIVTLDTPSSDDLTKQEEIRDGLAAVHIALFGTALGSEVERIVETVPGAARLAVASHHATPSEMRMWLTAEDQGWQRVSGDDEPIQWHTLVGRPEVGAYRSKDGVLTLLALPANLITELGPALSAARIPFREFAVSTESVIGGASTTSGLVVIVGRARSSAQQIAAPLRFETFATLVAGAQHADQLSQSYERNSPFAGKLSKNSPYPLRDWAPIYLSPELIDTEFGALLNITDQMLKSWSMAGEIEYLHFNYRKPDHFPFGGKPLLSVVNEKTGANSLLFNWNTAGSAVASRRDELTIVASTRSGALPVTYGADGKTASQGGAALFELEDEGYAYFSSLKDPNLDRVVQYTVLYQVLRRAVEDHAANSSRVAEASEHRWPPYVVEGRSRMAGGLRNLLAHIKKEPSSLRPTEAVKVVLSFIADHASLGEERLAALLADARSPEAHEYLQAEVRSYEERSVEFDRRVQEHNTKAKAFNSLIGLNGQAMRRLDAELTASKAALSAEQTELQNHSIGRRLHEAGKALQQILQSSTDIEESRHAYVVAFDHDTVGSIRTPSIVLSWGSKSTLGQGGHSLRSRALRLEVAPGVESIEIERGKDGSTRLLYNPALAEAVEGNAPRLARALEHRATKDIHQLKALAAEAPKARQPAEALAFDVAAQARNDHPALFARLGSRLYTGKADFVEDLRALAGDSACCIYVARDAQHNAYLAKPKLKPPPKATVRAVSDTPSLVQEIQRLSAEAQAEGGNKAVIFLDQSPEQVASIVRTAQAPATADRWIASMGSGGGSKDPPDPPGNASFFGTPDFDGKPSWLRSVMPDRLSDGMRRLLGRMARPMNREAWENARVVEMSSEEVRTQLAPLQWRVDHDGTPVGIRLTFGEGDNTAHTPVHMVAGIADATQTVAATQIMKAAAVLAVQEAAERNASVGQLLASMKSRLVGLSDEQVKRLVMVMDPDKSRMYMSQRAFPMSVAKLRREAVVNG